MQWAIQHREVNDYYYLYGLHRSDSAPASHFLSVGEMMGLIHRQTRGEEKQAVVGVFRDKYLFSLVAEALGHSSPRVIALLDSSEATWLSPRRSVSYDAFCGKAEQIDGFVKPLNGRQAAGAFTLQLERGRVLINGEESSPSALHERVEGRSLLQERIVQHEALSALHATSINTIRLVTVLSGGVVRPLVAALRIGVEGKSVDNWSAGGVVVAVDLEEGRLYGRGIYKPSTYELLRADAVAQHPTSGVPFDGYRLPFLQEGVALACDFHRDLGSLRSVGWDLAITPGGPTIVEGNTHWNGAMFMALDADFKRRYLEAVGEQGSL